MFGKQTIFGSKPSSSGLKQRVRHHRRQQPYGPGRQFRRTRHIDSYWRRIRNG